MEIFTDVTRNTYLSFIFYIFPDLYFNKISSRSHKRTFVISVLFKSQLAAELWKNNKQRSPAFIAVSFVLRTEAAVRDTVFLDLLGFFYWHQSGLLLLRCLLHEDWLTTKPASFSWGFFSADLPNSSHLWAGRTWFLSWSSCVPPAAASGPKWAWPGTAAVGNRLHGMCLKALSAALCTVAQYSSIFLVCFIFISIFFNFLISVVMFKSLPVTQSHLFGMSTWFQCFTLICCSICFF